MNKHVAMQIAFAQRCSDVPKLPKFDSLQIDESNRLGNLLGKKANARAQRLGYQGKDSAIYDAITAISHNPGCGFHFRVAEDKERVAKCIVYFDFKVNGKRMQVSFHSFDKRLVRLIEKEATGHWDRKQSRLACIALLVSFASDC